MTPDPSFGTGGRLQIYPSGIAGYYESYPRDGLGDMTVDQQGRIVLVGSALEKLSTGSSKALIVRLNADGSLDDSFSGDGILHFGWGYDDNYASAVAIDSEGRIVVAGGAGDPFSAGVPAVARFLPDGTPDPTFGQDGRATFPGSGGIREIAIDNQDRVLAASQIDANSHDLATIRFAHDGALDETFGGDGLVLTEFPGSESSFSATIAIDAAGRVVVGGGVAFINGTAFGVVRYRESGSLDPTFGSDGRALLDFGALNWEHANDVGVDNDGRIVIVGTGSSNALVGRLLPDGGPDPSFGDDGRVVTHRNGMLDAERVAIDDAGRIVVGGTEANEQAPPWFTPLVRSAFLLRYSPAGTLEEEGYVQEQLLGPGATGASLAIDREGRYLLAASQLVEEESWERGFIGLARFLVDYPPAPAASQPQPSIPPGTPSCNGKEATVVGTESRDVLRGTKRRDVILGLGGDDLLRGLAGDDLICGGQGNDVVRAGTGNDVLRGEGGGDLLFGGPGRDRLAGGPGRDRFVCGPGSDLAVAERRDRAAGCERTARHS